MREVLKEDSVQEEGCWYQMVCQEEEVTQPWVRAIRKRAVT